MGAVTKEMEKHKTNIRRRRTEIHLDQAIVERLNRAERLSRQQCAVEMGLPEGQRASCCGLCSERRSHSPHRQKTRRGHQRKGSCCKTLYSLFTPFRKKWKKSSPIINVRYLYQPGELEGGRQRANDAVWSLKVHNFLPPLVKPNEPIVYYLQDGPKRGFVLEELLAILPNTTLPFVSDTQ